MAVPHVGGWKPGDRNTFASDYSLCVPSSASVWCGSRSSRAGAPLPPPLLTRFNRAGEPHRSYDESGAVSVAFLARAGRMAAEGGPAVHSNTKFDGRQEVALAEGTSRIEAYSDGVFAIACTLLILEIRLPDAGGKGPLWADLVALWPSYLAFAFSFFVILVTWIVHYDLMRLIRVTTHPVLLANGCALIYVTFIPFPTAVLAAHLAGPEANMAVAFYCGTFVVGSGAFNLLVEAIARGQLCRPEVDAQAISRIRRGFRITFVIYLAATAIALVAPYVALALNIAVRVHLLRIRYQLVRSEAAV